jgi:transcriptional antiterminator RfaH
MSTAHSLEDIPGTDELPSATPAWYVLQTRPRQEERAKANLEAWSIETFFPKVLERRLNEYTGAATFIGKPLFPQYLFARFSANQAINRIRFTRGVDRIVSFGAGPCRVDEEIIGFLRSQVREDGYVRIGEELKYGDMVVVRHNLGQFTGIFERELSDGERVSILLMSISYQGRIVVNKNSVRRVASGMGSAVIYDGTAQARVWNLFNGTCH